MHSFRRFSPHPTPPPRHPPRWRPARALLLAAIAIAPLSACNSTPSAADGERVLREGLAGPSASSLALEGFQKVDGLATTEDGVPHYQMEFRTAVRLGVDVQYSIDASSRVGVGTAGKGIIFAQPVQPDATGSLTSFFYASQGLMIGRAGDRVRLAGTLGFIKSEAGWKPNRLALATITIDSSGRIGVAQSGAPAETSPASAAGMPVGPGAAAIAAPSAAPGARGASSVTEGRCVAEMAAHPTPVATLLDRVRGRRISEEAALLDSEYLLRPPTGQNPYRLELVGHAGRISYLITGELCAGPQFLTDVGAFRLSPGEAQVRLGPRLTPDGFRILSLGGDREILAQWLVHTDSTRALSGDVLAARQNSRAMPPDVAVSMWRARRTRSPAGRYLVVSAGSWKEEGVMAFDVVQGTATYLSLKNVLREHPEPGCYLGALDEATLNWRSEDVLVARVQAQEAATEGPLPPSCGKPLDPAALAVIDLTRKSVSRAP